MRGKRPSRWTLLVFALAAGGTLPLHRAHTVDDAYISLRYAENLVRGHGLVWNVGERVEGYTNFLWTLLLAAGVAVGADADLWMKGLGAVSGLGLAVFLTEWGRRRFGTSVGVLAGLFLVCTLTFAVWCTAGLETPLFGLFVFTGVACASDTLARPSRRAAWAAAGCLALASLTRPEGVLFLAACGGACLLAAWRRREPIAASMAPWLGAAFVVLVHFAWRRTYYGAWLPNTFAAKVPLSDLPALLPRGLHYAGTFVRELPWWALVPLAGLLSCLPRARRSPRVLFLAAIGLGTLVLPIAIGGDGLTAHRFFFPALPFLCLALAGGAVMLAGMLAPTSRRARGAGLTALALLTMVGFLSSHIRGRTIFNVRRETEEVAAWRAIGEWFGANVAADATIAVAVAGAIPRYSRLRAIDLLGLNDATIARTPVENPGEGQAGHERSNARYVLDRAPDYIVIGEYGLHEAVDLARPPLQFFYPAEEDLVRSPEFQRDYRLAAGRTPAGMFYYFSRRDSSAR